MLDLIQHEHLVKLHEKKIQPLFIVAKQVLCSSLVIKLDDVSIYVDGIGGNAAAWGVTT